MGFTNGTGPEGSPTFNNTPQTVTDLTRLRDLIIERGNGFKGTTTQRNALTAGQMYEGMSWFDTTLGVELVRRGSEWKRHVSFRTFGLARSAMTDGTVFFQVPTEDTAKDTEPAFAYTYDGANGRITPEAGIYLLHATGHPGGVATGTTFLQLLAATQGLLARGGVQINADPWMSCSALFRASGSEGFAVGIQKQTGGPANGSGVLSMTKLANL